MQPPWTETDDAGKPRDHCGAWVVQDKGCEVRFVPLGPARAIDAAITAWRESIGAATSCFVSKRKAAFCKRELNPTPARLSAARCTSATPLAAR